MVWHYLYLALKALHIIGFVAWFAGMFYIWRLFVYHVEADVDSTKATLDVMAEKLNRIIMVPASLFTLCCGLGLLWLRSELLLGTIWIYIKLAAIAGLFYWQYLANQYRQRLAARERFESSRIFRIYNEVPTLALLVIVLLAVFKPF